MNQPPGFGCGVADGGRAELEGGRGGGHSRSQSGGVARHGPFPGARGPPHPRLTWAFAREPPQAPLLSLCRQVPSRAVLTYTQSTLVPGGAGLKCEKGKFR